MADDEDMGFRIKSNRSDTVSLQNIDVELQRIRLSEISEVLPYLPDLSGLFSAEDNHVETAIPRSNLVEANIDELTYERQRIGDVALGVTWLPGERGKHYISTYLTHEGEEILMADGSLHPSVTGKDSIEVNAIDGTFSVKDSQCLCTGSGSHPFRRYGRWASHHR